MRIVFLFLLLAAAASISAQPKTSSDNKKIIGRWISKDDKKYEVVFTASKKTDLYEKKKVSTASYRIKNGILTATEADGTVFKYEIMGLTSKSLTLMYLTRGNLLTFKRK